MTVATGPRDVPQPHQGYPAQATGLDRMIAAGAHRVPVDPQRADPCTLPSLQGFVDAEYQRTVATVQLLEQEI